LIFSVSGAPATATSPVTTFTASIPASNIPPPPIS
jgi:hypothetical protein